MSSHRKTMIVVMVCASLSVLSVALVTVVAVQSHGDRKDRIRQVNAINKAQCDALQTVFEAIRKTVSSGDASLAGLDYYKHHPGELAQQHRANLATVERFGQPPCPANVQLPGGS